MTLLTLRPRNRRTPGALDLRVLSVEDLSDLAVRLAGRPVPDVRMTEAAFTAWCPSDVRAEWVDGGVVLMAPVSDEHDDLTTWLIALFRLLAEDEAAGVVRHDMFVRLPGQRGRRLPDLMFIAAARSDVVKPTVVDGAPDLVVEVVSRDSQSRDRREKYIAYERAGVREYWIIDPLSRTLDAYALERKRYHAIDADKAGWVASAVARPFRLKPDLLWQRPLPKVAAALRQMRAARPK